MLEIFTFSISFVSLSLLFLAAFLVGMAKTGVFGVVMVAVPLLALIFGAKASTGLMLPLLIMADIFAVANYHRHANWHYLIKLFPSAALGVIVGTWLGSLIDQQLFATLMSLTIFASLGIMLWMEKTNKDAIPDYLWFALLMGFLGGLTTMLGNLAGSVMAVYLLSMRLPKNAFIGTAAWFFLIINLFKVPFHVFVWQTIDSNSLKMSLISLPFIALGAWAGVNIVRAIPEQHYRWLLIVMTAAAAMLMLFK